MPVLASPVVLNHSVPPERNTVVFVAISKAISSEESASLINLSTAIVPTLVIFASLKDVDPNVFAAAVEVIPD